MQDVVNAQNARKNLSFVISSIQIERVNYRGQLNNTIKILLKLFSLTKVIKLICNLNKRINFCYSNFLRCGILAYEEQRHPARDALKLKRAPQREKRLICKR